MEASRPGGRLQSQQSLRSRQVVILAGHIGEELREVDPGAKRPRETR